MGLLYTAIFLLGCTSGFASHVFSVSIVSDAADRLDKRLATPPHDRTDCRFRLQ